MMLRQGIWTWDSCSKSLESGVLTVGGAKWPETHRKIYQEDEMGDRERGCVCTENSSLDLNERYTGEQVSLPWPSITPSWVVRPWTPSLWKVHQLCSSSPGYKVPVQIPTRLSWAVWSILASLSWPLLSLAYSARFSSGPFGEHKSSVHLTSEQF